MTYDYERRVTAADRIWIDNGKLIVAKNAALEARPHMIFMDCEVMEVLEYQVYDERGTPSRVDYRGPGQVVTRGAENAVIMGDPYRHATLNEGKVDKKPTPESDKRFDAVVAVVKAAIGEFKPGRRQKAKGPDWLRGYDEAMAYRKKVTPK